MLHIVIALQWQLYVRCVLCLYCTLALLACDCTVNWQGKTRVGHMLGHKAFYSFTCVPILCMMALIILITEQRLLAVFHSAHYDGSEESELQCSVRMAWGSVQQAVRCWRNYCSKCRPHFKVIRNLVTWSGSGLQQSQIYIWIPEKDKNKPLPE